MMDQTHVVNEAKEKCCFVSDNFARDLDICKSVLAAGRFSPPQITVFRTND